MEKEITFPEHIQTEKQIGQKDEENDNTISAQAPRLSHRNRLSSGAIALEHGYTFLLEEQRKLWPEVPDISIHFNNLAYTLYVPKKMHDMPNIAKSALNTMKLLWPPFWKKMFAKESERPDREKFLVLHNCTGELLPGRMNLLLAPPGHGKTALMRTLAGQIDSKHLSGDVTYSGTSRASVQGALNKMIAYVDQLDIHLPQLTVRETLQFAKDTTVVNSHHLNDPALVKATDRRVDTFLKLLGLEECADTIVGNELLRGVSGGQKKRVTIGEMMISNARVLLMDEISTGLDSAVTRDIIASVQSWTRYMRGTVMAALLQPPPDVYELFDDLTLLREGQIIYQGPRTKVFDYLALFGISYPTDMDEADFLTEFINDPSRMWKKQHRILDDDVDDSSSAASATDEVTPHNSAESDSESPLIQPEFSTQALVTEWNRFKTSRTKNTTTKAAENRDTGSTIRTDMNIATNGSTQTEYEYSLTEPSLALKNKFAEKQYGSEYAHTLWTLTKLCVIRQTKLMARNPQLIGSRIGQSVFVGLILGSCFLDLGLEEFNLKIGVVLFVAIFLAFANMAEVPVAIEARNVVQKQTAAGFYPTGSYAISVLLMHFPLALAETFIFSVIIYWMSSFAVDAGRFFFFILILFCQALCMSVVFRSIAYACPNMEVAQVFAGPVTAGMLLFGGFLITRKNIPEALRWVYWLSPFAWSTRSLVQNELFSEDYDVVVPGTGGKTLGVLGLETYEFPTDSAFKWGGFGVLFGYYIFFGIVMGLILAYKRIQLNVGTSRANIEDIDTSSTDVRHTEQKDSSLSSASALPFQPMSLAFQNITYDVTINKNETKRLLRGISGVAKPGTMTALMGASGAGKTTLMDVIAGRKTAGTMTGNIYINGYEKEQVTFARVTGYVEQADIHMQYLSVYESLMFAAELRLPESVTKQQREAFVQEVMKLLELSDLADRMVGALGEDDGGLAPGQRKRLTIAVELVSNPSILFLDEPTSGLDSRSALTVMRVVKNIANTGRTVVCTIHQPSAELFYMFDSLLLLKSGGYQVYAGPLGARAKYLRRFMENNGAHPCPSHTNPADWMLDQLGVGTNGASSNSSDENPSNDEHIAEETEKGQVKNSIDFAQVFAHSELKASNDTIVKGCCTPAQDSKQLQFDSMYATTKLKQFQVLLHRVSFSYWRNVSYNWTRFVVLIIVGLLFGLLFWKIRDGADNVAAVLSVVSLSFNCVAFGGVVCYSTVLPVIGKERAVYYRERASNMYASTMYSAALTVIEIPYILVISTVFGTIYYFLASFENDAGVYFHFMLIHFIVSLLLCYFGMLFAAALPNVEIAQIIGSVFITMFFLFGGVFVPKPQLPSGWIWMYYLNPVAYATNIMSSLQLYCEGTNCPTVDVPFGDGTVTEVSRYEYAKDAYDFNYDDRWIHTGILVAFLVAFRLLGVLALKKINHMKR